MDDQNTDNNQQQGAYNGPISVGGFSPEVVSNVSTPEQGPAEESGYEQIRKIEKAAESSEKQEVQRQAERSDKQIKEDAQRREKKEVPTGVKTKYFGYNPPPSITQNTDYIRQNAGKGNKSDAKTWLLVFLDRLLKKED